MHLIEGLFWGFASILFIGPVVFELINVRISFIQNILKLILCYQKKFYEKRLRIYPVNFLLMN